MCEKCKQREKIKFIGEHKELIDSISNLSKRVKMLEDKLQQSDVSVSFCDCEGLPSDIELKDNKCLACGNKFMQNEH